MTLALNRVLVVAVLAGPFFSGCTLFPGEFPEVQDAGVDSGTVGPAVRDFCNGAVPLSVSSETASEVSFDDFSDTVGSLQGCSVTGLTGPDMFLRFDTSVNERWRISVEPLDNADVLAHVSNSCLTTQCRVAEDVCGAGFPEDFIFKSPAAGIYSLGIDAVSGGGRVRVRIENTFCGNGDAQVGKACDDGNVVNGDGCSDECLLELRPNDLVANPQEREPNERPLEANIVLLPEGEGGVTETTGTVRIPGRIGGACDRDVFAVPVQQGQSIAVTVLDENGNPCASGAPPLTLALLNDNEIFSERGVGVIAGADDECPAIGTEAPAFAFAQDLEAGTYYVRLNGEREASQFLYNLDITISGGAI